MGALLRSARRLALPTILMAAAIPVHAQPPVRGVSLKVSRETAPPGAISQMKVFITEPKPITSGWASMTFDAFSDIEGIALGAGDAAGIAVVHGGEIVLSIVSPSGSFGMDPDYPVLTIAGRVAATAPVGTRVPMTIDPAALQMIGPGGTVYPTESKDGYLEVGGDLSIGDVIPGSADVPAGGVVSIFGTGFQPDTKLRVRETLLSGTRYVGPNRIDMVLAGPTHMRGAAIRARNRAGSDATYFSYQRTRASGGSTEPLLQDVVPVFPDASASQYALDLGPTTAGIALQNLEATAATVVAQLTDTTGLLLAEASVAVPSSGYVVRSLGEIFGFSPASPAVVTLTAATPVQALGVDVDAAGSATPRLPR